MNGDYPLRFSVDYPDRDLDRVTTLLRLFMVIPIAIVLSLVSGPETWQEWGSGGGWTTTDGGWYQTGTTTLVIGAGGLLFLPPLLMLLFRAKYPRWWFDWNLELLRFQARVSAYVALMDDHYPSTDAHQAVRLDCPYPDASRLNRWLPLIKWFLAIPHYIVLFFLSIAATVAIIVVWFVILFTGRYPRGLFAFVEGYLRWGYRVTAYAFILTTDVYPPFRLAE